MTNGRKWDGKDTNGGFVKCIMDLVMGAQIDRWINGRKWRLGQMGTRQRKLTMGGAVWPRRASWDLSVFCFCVRLVFSVVLFSVFHIWERTASI